MKAIITTSSGVQVYEDIKEVTSFEGPRQVSITLIDKGNCDIETWPAREILLIQLIP